MADDDTSRLPPTERIAILEEKVREHASKLREGATAFEGIRGVIKSNDDSLRTELKQLGPKPIPKMQIVGFVFAVISFLAAIIFAAGRYPTAEKFDGLEQRLQQRLQALEMAQSLQARDLATLTDSIKRQEALEAAVSGKLDAILFAKKGTP